MYSKIVKKGMIILLSLWMVNVFAAQDPVQMLQQTTDEMLADLQNTPNRTTSKLYTIVKKTIVPHVALDYMSQQVTGRYWSQATPQQRDEFQTEFTRFVTQTYSTALSSYTDEKVRYFPIRGGYRKCPAPMQQHSCVKVNSQIDRKNGPPIALNYSLINLEGGWKVYNFSVEGVSIVENYRSQFADVLHTQGFEGLLQKLRSHNVGKK